MVPPMGAAGLMPSAAVSAPLGPKQDIGEEGGWDLYLLGAKMASARPAAASLIDAVHILHESTAWALAVVPSGRQDELVCRIWAPGNLSNLSKVRSCQGKMAPGWSRRLNNWGNFTGIKGITGTDRGVVLRCIELLWSVECQGETHGPAALVAAGYERATVAFCLHEHTYELVFV
jgi:hypothetical protein